MTEDLKHSQLRTVQYFFVDGSFEVGFGFLCLILAVFFYTETRVEGWVSGLVDGSLVLVMIGGAWLINRLIKQIKERITWPRSGYITYTRPEGRRRTWRIVLGMLGGGLVAVAATVFTSTSNLHIAVIPLLSGCLLGLVMVFLGWRASILRFYLLGLVSAFLGLALAYSRWPDSTPLAGYYFFFGLVLLLSGICALRSYLRRNPLPTGEIHN